MNLCFVVQNYEQFFESLKLSGFVEVGKVIDMFVDFFREDDD